MHRCSNNHGNSVNPCSCGWFPPATSSNSFSMLFPMPNHQYEYQSYDEVISDSYPLSSSSSAVDCTLSLGTPSTRQIDHSNRKSGSCVSNLCWDLFQSKKSSSYKHSSSSSRGGGGGGGSSSGSNTATTTILNNLNTGDPLLARRCANCDTTSTPLWRNGPRGPKSLCNACGIRYKKEERRATSNATAAAMEQQQYHNHYSSWAHHGGQGQMVGSISSGSIGNHEFRFMEEDDQYHGSSDTTGIPFMSWRLNVPDRHSSLVHHYT